MWQTKYASAVPKNLGVGVNFGCAVKAISSLGVRSSWLKVCVYDELSSDNVSTHIHTIILIKTNIMSNW